MINRPNIINKIFKIIITTIAIIVLFIVAGILVILLINSIPAFEEIGLDFLFQTEWNSDENKYGSLPFIFGTLITSIIAIIISLPISLAIALFLGEYYKKGKLSNFFRIVIEILSFIPSIIYGIWGYFFLSNITGYGVFTASLILAIMIIPFSSSICLNAIRNVPKTLKDAAYSMGATQFDVVKIVILQYAKTGIIAGILLSLSKVIGEAIAVVMVIGNRSQISFFDSGSTIASSLITKFSDSSGLKTNVLFILALILFFFSILINIIGKYAIKKIGNGNNNEK